MCYHESGTACENQIEKKIICSETRTKSQHQPNQRGVDSATKNATIKFQLFLASVHLKTKIISMFYFRENSNKRSETHDI